MPLACCLAMRSAPPPSRACLTELCAAAGCVDLQSYALYLRSCSRCGPTSLAGRCNGRSREGLQGIPVTFHRIRCVRVERGNRLMPANRHTCGARTSRSPLPADKSNATKLSKTVRLIQGLAQSGSPHQRRLRDANVGAKHARRTSDGRCRAVRHASTPQIDRRGFRGSGRCPVLQAINGARHAVPSPWDGERREHGIPPTTCESDPGTVGATHASPLQRSGIDRTDATGRLSSSRRAGRPPAPAGCGDLPQSDASVGSREHCPGHTTSRRPAESMLSSDPSVPRHGSQQVAVRLEQAREAEQVSGDGRQHEDLLAAAKIVIRSTSPCVTTISASAGFPALRNLSPAGSRPLSVEEARSGLELRSPGRSWRCRAGWHPGTRRRSGSVEVSRVRSCVLLLLEPCPRRLDGPGDG